MDTIRDKPLRSGKYASNHLPGCQKTINKHTNPCAFTGREETLMRTNINIIRKFVYLHLKLLITASTVNTKQPILPGQVQFWYMKF